MQTNSTGFLGLIAKNNCYIVFEKGSPSGRLKRDFISFTTRDGRALSLSTPQGFQAYAIELPREIFDDFIRASFIEQDGLEDSEGRIIYRLTRDGYARAAESGAIMSLNHQNIGEARDLPLGSIVKVLALDYELCGKLSHWGFNLAPMGKESQWQIMRKDLLEAGAIV